MKIRQQASEKIGAWSQFQNKYLDIQRLLQHRDLQSALQQAQSLLQQTLQAGTTAYQGADYDMAMAYFLLGRVLNEGGLAEEALTNLQLAQQGFQALVDNGNQSGAGMASASLTEQGNCLRNLGRLDTAVEKYQQAIRLQEKRDAKRDVAVGKGQLATVRLLQKDYQAALTDYVEARKIFEQLNEPQMIATAWHQIGRVYGEVP